ncbi:hypothetical protein ACQY0O_005561 [Thecaphora frezii]
MVRPRYPHGLVLLLSLCITTFLLGTSAHPSPVFDSIISKLLYKSRTLLSRSGEAVHSDPAPSSSGWQEMQNKIHAIWPGELPRIPFEYEPSIAPIVEQWQARAQTPMSAATNAYGVAELSLFEPLHWMAKLEGQELLSERATQIRHEAVAVLKELAKIRNDGRQGKLSTSAFDKSVILYNARQHLLEAVASLETIQQSYFGSAGRLRNVELIDKLLGDIHYALDVAEQARILLEKRHHDLELGKEILARAATETYIDGGKEIAQKELENLEREYAIATREWKSVATNVHRRWRSYTMAVEKRTGRRYEFNDVHGTERPMTSQQSRILRQM